MNLSKENQELLTGLVKILKEKKCEEIKILDLSKIHNYLNFFIIATSKTEAQARSVSKDAEKLIKSFQLKVSKNLQSTLSSNRSGWILLDYGEVCIHIMNSETRKYYDLERLWGDAEEVVLA